MRIEQAALWSQLRIDRNPAQNGRSAGEQETHRTHTGQRKMSAINATVPKREPGHPQTRAFYRINHDREIRKVLISPDSGEKGMTRDTN